MKKIMYVCDCCEVEVSEKSRVIGWITLDLDEERHLEIKVQNTAFPNLGCGTRFVKLPDSLEFCSLSCLIEYFRSKVER